MINHLPLDRLERIESWGQASSGMNYVYRPSTGDGLRGVLALAKNLGVSVGFRGAGQSYGDAALNDERILIDLRRMNRILEWEPERGVISVEPGVSVRQLWRYVLGDGWWPPVVPGTMFPTLGGCLAMNIHGKNNWQAGTLGDHVVSFEAMLANGEIIRCRPGDQHDLFRAMIGGLGMLGCFTRITLQLKRLYSGLMRVRSLTEPDIDAMVARMDALKDSVDYVVGWVDGVARGSSLGRGQIHTADYLPPGVDPHPAQTLRLENQDLPETFFGLVPKSSLWRFMQPFMNNLGVPWINRGRYWSARFQGDHRFQQSLAEFNFLLDYVPGWKKAYLPGGLIQFQCFIPKACAGETFRQMIMLSQKRRLPTYLGVLKRHRPDSFLLSHAVDGFSLAMDFKITRRNRENLLAMHRDFEAIVLESGGRFYFAKDSALSRETVGAYLGAEPLAKFRELKRQYDPHSLFQTNLSRRLLPELHFERVEAAPRRVSLQAERTT